MHFIIYNNKMHIASNTNLEKKIIFKNFGMEQVFSSPQIPTQKLVPALRLLT